jgi:hypothetical protein
VACVACVGGNCPVNGEVSMFPYYFKKRQCDPFFFQVLPSENCHTHGMPLALWCHTCCAAICRACATQQDHPGHQVKSQGEAKEQLVSEVCICAYVPGELNLYLSPQYINSFIV